MAGDFIMAIWPGKDYRETKKRGITAQGADNKDDIYTAYRNGPEHINDELKRLELLVYLRLLSKPGGSIGENSSIKGLVISPEEVFRLLLDSSHAGDMQNSSSSADHIAERERVLSKLRELDVIIDRRRRAAAGEGVFLPLAYLSELFNLQPFAEQCLVACLAVELDRRFEKLFAYLQDDVTCRYPTISLLTDLLCSSRAEKEMVWSAFNPEGYLMTYLLDKKAFQDEKRGISSRRLKLDNRLISIFTDGTPLDSSLHSFTELINPVDPGQYHAGNDSLPSLFLQREVQEQLRDYIKAHFLKDKDREGGLIILLTGYRGSGRRLQVKHFCRYFANSLLLADVRRLTDSPDADPRELFHKIFREAILHQAVLAIYNFQDTLEKEQQDERPAAAGSGFIGALIEELQEFRGITFLLSEKEWKPVDVLEQHKFFHVDLDIPSGLQRKELWEYFAEKAGFQGEADWGDLAGKFSFTPGQVEKALATASSLAAWEGRKEGQVTVRELHQACHAQIQHRLGEKATLIRASSRWDDLILPAAQKSLLRNACNQMKYRHIVLSKWGFDKRLSYGKGLTMMFSGSPGTGKTMAAGVVAKELFLEIYKIDLSRIMSKYIGETEKNLQEIFSEARFSNAILFFDEADALFGKRTDVKDARDKYANVETAYLLQKMEEYEGISILATNLLQNIDEAFIRRITFVIKFPFPDMKYREMIWRSLFPAETPMDDDVDYSFLAQKFEITGGQIKNIALAAAFLAAADNGGPVSMKHIINAARQELQKTGKVLLKEDLGEYYEDD